MIRNVTPTRRIDGGIMPTITVIEIAVAGCVVFCLGGCDDTERAAPRNTSIADTDIIDYRTFEPTRIAVSEKVRIDGMAHDLVDRVRLMAS